MKKFWVKEKTELEKEIDSLIERLTHIDPGSEEYGIVADNLGKLQKIELTKEERVKVFLELVKILGSFGATVGGMLFISIQNQAIMDFERDGTLRSSAWKLSPKLANLFGKNKTVNM